MERQKEQDLSGKVAIVTGASRGVGKQAALLFGALGVKVVVAARTVKPGRLPGAIGETVALIEEKGGEALAVATDLSKEEDLHNLAQASVDRFGGVDFLVNNAAVTEIGSWTAPFEEIPREDWLYQFAVNCHAPFTLMQLVAPIMEKRGGGRILNVTTGCAEVMRQPEELPHPDSYGDLPLALPAYFSSKRALDRLGSVLAPYLRKKNISIIGVMPGFAASEITVERVEQSGMDKSWMVPMSVPARMLAYFAACENPMKYTGRLFWAERELQTLGIDVEGWTPNPLPV